MLQELILCELERLNPEANSSVTFCLFLRVDGVCRGRNDPGDDLVLDVIRQLAGLITN